MKGRNMTLTELKNQRQDRVNQILKDNDVFWAFGEDQLKEGMKEHGVKEIDELVSIGAGGLMPKVSVTKFTQDMKDLNVWYKEQEKTLDDKIRLKKISAERYSDMLDVLPPIYHPNGVFQVSEAYDHVMLDGVEQARYDTFVKRGKNHYCAGILTKKQARAFAEGGICRRGNKMNITIEQLKTYLIDVLGYRDYELEEYTKEELQGIVNTEGSVSELLEFSDIDEWGEHPTVQNLDGSGNF